MKITVIGAGNMGGALAKGWARAMSCQPNCPKHEITVTARTRQTLDRISSEFPELHTSLDNKAAVTEADVIVLAVKPWLVEDVVREISPAVDLNRQVLVSVAANILTDDLRRMFGNDKADVFYAMPNIAVEFGAGMVFLSPAKGVSGKLVEEMERLFALTGEVMVCSEQTLAAGNMLSGCGIAYVMRFIRAMMEGGVELGLYPRDAQAIVQQAMLGAVTLLKETGIHPEAAIDKVTTPGGLTIKGLNELDHSGFSSAVIRCLKAGMRK